MNIFFDMDGTIADLYSVENWLEDLIHEETRPYTEARPLLNLSQLARLLNRLNNNGHTINIISWTSKNGTSTYNEAVKQAKLQWLEKHLKSVHFTEIIIIPYGTPKRLYGEGILFDDEEHNRIDWGEGAYSEKEIIQVLKSLL